MGFTAKVLKVFIASPNDTTTERDQVEDIIHEWNNLYSERQKIILLPVRWEKSISPEYSTKLDGQEIINKRILIDSDILIMILKSKLGSPTVRSASGTLEELYVFSKENEEKIGIFFCDTTAPTTTDSLKEYQKVITFREKLAAESRGIYGVYREKEIDNFLTRQVATYTAKQEFEIEKTEEIKESSIDNLLSTLSEGFLRPDELLFLNFMYTEGYNTIELNTQFKDYIYIPFLDSNGYKHKYSELLNQTCNRLVDRKILEFLGMSDFFNPYTDEYEEEPQFKLNIKTYDRLGKTFDDYESEVNELLNQCLE